MQIGVDGQVQPCQLSSVICGLALLHCGLFRRGQGRLLAAVQSCLSFYKFLLGRLQGRLGRNALVCKRNLLRAVKLGLGFGKSLLSRLDTCLLSAVKLGFGRSKSLLGRLQGRLGRNALVCKTDLLSPVKLGLGF